MKKVLYRIIGIVLTLILIIQNVNAYALTEKEELQNEQAENDEQIEEIKKKQEEIEAQKSEAMKAVEGLIEQISEAETKKNELQKNVNNLQTQIEEKKNDIETKEEEYNKQQELVDARLIAIYESGQTSYLEILLSASSMTEFLAKYYCASELLEYDKQLIQSIKDQKAQIEQEKTELEANKSELEVSLAEQEKIEKELKQLKAEKDDEAANLTAEEKKLQKEIEELEEANRQIAKDIEEAEKKYEQQINDLENVPAGSGFFSSPVNSNNITAKAYYSSGKFHGAIDYGIPVGTPVYAAAEGVVMSTANLTNSYGTYVVIRHANGLQSYYCHGTRGSIVVSPGDTVKKGQKIMLSGNTGNSTGPHLHFEVRKSPYNYKSSATAYGQDSRVNPLNYM